MALPLLPLIAIAGAGAIAGVGASSIFGGGGSANPTTTSTIYEAPYRTYSPIYSPTTSTQETFIDARQISDSRQLMYSPIYQIESPYATITKKDALINEPKQQQAITPQQQLEVLPQVTGATSTEDRAITTNTGLSPLVILGGALILGGAYFLAQKK